MTLRGESFGDMAWTEAIAEIKKLRSENKRLLGLISEAANMMAGHPLYAEAICDGDEWRGVDNLYSRMRAALEDMKP